MRCERCAELSHHQVHTPWRAATSAGDWGPPRALAEREAWWAGVGARLPQTSEAVQLRRPVISSSAGDETSHTVRPRARTSGYMPLGRSGWQGSMVAVRRRPLVNCGSSSRAPAAEFMRADWVRREGHGGEAAGMPRKTRRTIARPQASSRASTERAPGFAGSHMRSPRGLPENRR